MCVLGGYGTNGTKGKFGKNHYNLCIYFDRVFEGHFSSDYTGPPITDSLRFCAQGDTGMAGDLGIKGDQVCEANRCFEISSCLLKCINLSLRGF